MFKVVSFTVMAGSFFALTVYSMHIGGDAFQGHVENGRYFVGDHGNYTEVDKRTFFFSQIFVYGTILIWAILFPSVLVVSIWHEYLRFRHRN